MSRDTDLLRAELMADLSVPEATATPATPASPATPATPVPRPAALPSPALVVTLTPLSWSWPRLRLTHLALGPLTVLLH